MKESQISPFEHSEIKIKLLKLYLEKYMIVLSNAFGKREIDVYDVFCSEGVYENGIEGSPIIILNIINDIFPRYKERIKFNCYFNDLDPTKTSKLSNIISNKNLDKNLSLLTISNKNYQDLKLEIINQRKSNNHKAFVFIDPYDYKNITISDIQGLLNDGNTEVLLFLPTQFMYRFEKKGTPFVLYDFLNQVMNEEDLQKSENGIDFINNLRDGFASKLNRHYVDAFIITRELNQFFALFFFTSHIYGFEKFLEAKWTIDEEEGRGWSPNDSKEDLFSDLTIKPNIDKFETEFLNFLKDERSNIEIHNFTIMNRHLPKHANSVLGNLQSADKLEISMIDGSKIRKKAFYIGWNEIKTGIIKCFIKLKNN